MWRPRTALVIAAFFLIAATVYWFGSGYGDPAGFVMLLFAAGAISFGLTILFRASEDL
jgi:hypothetical protein